MSDQPAPPQGSRSTLLIVVLFVVAAGLVGVGAVLAAGGPGDDVDDSAGADGLSVHDAWTGPNGSITAVYLTIDNGEDEDRLVGVTTEVAETALLMGRDADMGHSSVEGAEAVALAVPSGRTELAPGGRHLMLTDLTRALDPGDEFRLELTFEQAGPVDVPVEVVSWDQVAERAG